MCLCCCIIEENKNVRHSRQSFGWVGNEPCNYSSAVAKNKNRAERFKEKRYISRHILIILLTVMCFPCPSFLLNPFDWFQKGLGWKRWCLVYWLFLLVWNTEIQKHFFFAWIRIFVNKTDTSLKGRSCLYTSKPNFSNLTNVAAV